MMRSRLAIGLALATLASAPSARAALTLDIASILAVEDDSGWHVQAELEGSADVTSADLAPPGGPSFPLSCESLAGEGSECAFESAGFASLAALLAAYPSGEWQLSLNGGARTAGLLFAPTEPDGLVTVTSPADRAVNVDPTPDIDWSHDCTNCVALAFDIQEITAPLNVGLERFVASPAASGTVTWGQLQSYQGPKPAALPDGRYALTASTAVGAMATEHLTPGNDAFEYSEGALRGVRTTFTVPEPHALAGGLAVLAGLAAAARRRAQPPAATSVSRMSIQPSRA